MANLLDNLFAWAKENYKTPKHLVMVNINMAGTETNNVDKSFVSYEGGVLTYKPFGGVHIPGQPYKAAHFTSGNLAVYYSDRLYGAPGYIPFTPFDPKRVDSSEVEIIQIGHEIIHVPPPSSVLYSYEVHVKSLTWSSSGWFVPKVDEATGVLYGAMGTSFVTIGLYSKSVQVEP